MRVLKLLRLLKFVRTQNLHDGFEPYLVGFDDLDEGGGGVHVSAEPVGLPAHEGVEASASGVGQHPLELGALLDQPRPTSW